MAGRTALLRRAAAIVTRGRSPAQRAYLLRCAGLDGDVALPDPGPAAMASLDAILDEAWQGRTKADRTALGQVFTPRRVARQVFDELPNSGPRVRVLDPSCGGGIFLVEAARWLEPRLPPEGPERARTLQEDLLGIDVDPVAASLARLLMGDRLVDALGDADPHDLPLPQVIVADATDPETSEAIDAFAPTHVVGNPPYLEAKRMPNPDRDRLRARLPELSGAFDVYMAFVFLALRWVGREGVVALVLPNKVQVARYAAPLRARLTTAGRLHALVDLSELPVFARVGVYPIVVVIGPARDDPEASFKACHRLTDLEGLGRGPLLGERVPHGLLGRLMTPPVWFTVPPGGFASLMQRLLADFPRLADVATVRSTCSFHRKGLRERFVKPAEELPDGVPYLGGRSWSRRNEVRPFRVDWAGYRIDFAADELRALRNPIPPLACFRRPKVILCQHARTLVAYADTEGRFVTKDVFPIVLPHEVTPQAALGLAAVLNSRVASVLYATWFRGIQISGGYLHFLPVYLRHLPVPDPSRWAALVDLAASLQSVADETVASRLDDTVMDAYALSADERVHVRAVADERLGFAPEVLARR